ncbi:MAG: hypothetical protein V4492_00125 [Chlamydiota bacterium]
MVADSKPEMNDVGNELIAHHLIYQVQNEITGNGADKKGETSGANPKVASLLSLASSLVKLGSSLEGAPVEGEHAPESSAPLFKSSGDKVEQPDVEQFIQALFKPEGETSPAVLLKNTANAEKLFDHLGTVVKTTSEHAEKAMPLVLKLQSSVTEVLAAIPQPTGEMDDDAVESHAVNTALVLIPKLGEFATGMREFVTSATGAEGAAAGFTASSPLEQLSLAVEQSISYFQEISLAQSNATFQHSEAIGSSEVRAAQNVEKQAQQELKKIEEKLRRRKVLGIFGKIIGAIVSTLVCIVNPALAPAVMTLFVMSASGATPKMLNGLAKAFGGGTGAKILSDLVFVASVVATSGGGAAAVESFMDDAAANPVPRSSNRVMNWLEDKNPLKGRPVLAASLVGGTAATMQSGLLLHLAQLVPQGSGRTATEAVLGTAGVVGTLLAGLFGGIATFKPALLTSPGLMLGLHYTRMATSLFKGVVDGAMAGNMFTTAVLQGSEQKDNAMVKYLQDNNGTAMDTMGQSLRTLGKLSSSYSQMLGSAESEFIQMGYYLSQIGVN